MELFRELDWSAIEPFGPLLKVSYGSGCSNERREGSWNMGEEVSPTPARLGVKAPGVRRVCV